MAFCNFWVRNICQGNRICVYICLTPLRTCTGQAPGFLETVANKGHYLRTQLQQKIGSNHHVKEIRGIGLLVGIELDVAAAPLINAALNAGLLILSAGKGNVVRLAPPLTISEKELNAAVDILAHCMPSLG